MALLLPWSGCKPRHPCRLRAGDGPASSPFGQYPASQLCCAADRSFDRSFVPQGCSMTTVTIVCHNRLHVMCAQEWRSAHKVVNDKNDVISTDSQSNP